MTPSHGVITLFGHGIRVYVERGHLVLEDGIGTRLRSRFSRIRHGIRRLVVIGSDGMVTLGALRWLADQDAAFVMLERDGSVLTTTGPVRPSDARLRRAQILSHTTGLALQIARELIGQKLDAQLKLAREGLGDAVAAEAIVQFRESLRTAGSIDFVRLLESQAARAYWSACSKVPINFPKRDVERVPDHWRSFGARISPLTGSPRLAVNPPNAILNYLYALLESETRLAIATLGLDPGLGVMHADTPTRDSLATDIMEPIRPQVDAYLLNWIRREPLKREWFFEQRDGSCRLMGSFAVELSKTAPTWGQLVGPIAEWFSRTLWSTIPRGIRRDRAPSRLTQTHRREAKGTTAPSLARPAPQPPTLCRICGAAIRRDRTHCDSCAVIPSTEALLKAGIQGRIAAQTPDAQKRRAEAGYRNAAARRAWRQAGGPSSIDQKTYVDRIQPRLSTLTNSTVSAALGVSIPYAVDIRAGRRIPHPRHWEKLARLIAIVETPDGVVHS